VEPVIARAKPPPVGPTDEELVRRIIAGETALFEMLMRRHNRKVFRAVRSILRNSPEVEDVMQQAYISAYTHLGTFAGEAQFSTWLVRIAINEALGRKRRAQRLTFVEEIQEHAMSTSTSHPGPEQAFADREIATLIESAVDTLPEMYREVFMLREIEGLSTQETADVLGCSADVVKTRLHRARALLSGRLTAVAREGLETAFSFDGERCDRIVARVMSVIAR
jgi:RNA polymerase sigma-70 factor (ECF subfamily)